MLVNPGLFGLPIEPTPRGEIAEGADLVTFSGDKLLDGPQCGRIAGTREVIERIHGNPMKRALRLDKVRLAAPEAVLRLFADPAGLCAQLPTLCLLTRTRDDIEQQAPRLVQPFSAAAGFHCHAAVAAYAGQVGSEALPVDTLPSTASKLELPAGPGADVIATALRRLPVPVLGCISGEAVLLRLRCLEETQEGKFVQQLAALRLQATS